MTSSPPVTPPEDKDAAIFPRRFDAVGRERAHLDLLLPGPRAWGDHSCCWRDGAWCDAGKIGLGPRPLETPEGRLRCHHGTDAKVSGPVYRVGLALLDVDDPGRVMRHMDEWVPAPTEPHKRSGDVDKVVFPTGWLIDPATQRLSIYYAADDSVIALVSASLSDVPSLLRGDPSASGVLV